MSFFEKENIFFSDILNISGVSHGFGTRLGGVSEDKYAGAMNISLGRGDDRETVLKNIELLSGMCGLSPEGVVFTDQIHSSKVLYKDKTSCGEGFLKKVPDPCDGFVTDVPGVVLAVKTADCVPILMVGEKKDKSPVVCALHAGWRGTVGGIAYFGVERMVEVGALRESIRAAIGPHIHSCCFEVGEEFPEAVREAENKSGLNIIQAEKYIFRDNGRLRLNLADINRVYLTAAGVGLEKIDVCDECTACDPEKFHSHRASKGKRGTMGNMIGILETL